MGSLWYWRVSLPSLFYRSPPHLITPYFSSSLLSIRMPCCASFRRRSLTTTTTTVVQPDGTHRSCFHACVLSSAMLDRLLPYRNALIVMAVVTFLFALLVVLENILYISANEKYAWLLLIPYLLSWILLIVGFGFAHIAHRVNEHRKNQSRRERSRYQETSRAPSPTQSLSASANAQMLGQLSMASYMMCDTGAGPQIFLSSPYMGYSPYPFYPPGTPMPQSPFILSPSSSLGFTPCDLRVPSTLPSPGTLSPLSPLSPSTSAPISDPETMMAIVPPVEPPTYLEAIRGTGPTPAEPREEYQ